VGSPAASPPSSASWSKQCCTPSRPVGRQRRFRAEWPAGPRSRARWPNSLQALMAAAPWHCQTGRRQVEGRRNAWLRRGNGAEGDGEQRENVARTWGSVSHGAQRPMLPTLRLGQKWVGYALLLPPHVLPPRPQVRCKGWCILLSKQVAGPAAPRPAVSYVVTARLPPRLQPRLPPRRYVGACTGLAVSTGLISNIRLAASHRHA
jgi:hypothetical protein